MADNDPNLENNRGNNLPESSNNPPASGSGMPNPLGGGKNSSVNPIKQKEIDIMDPEAKAKSTQKKSLSDVVNDVKDKADKARKTIQAISKVLQALGPWGCLILLIIIIIIGLWGFFHYMPGLTIGKLKEIAQKAADFVESIFVPDAVAYINDDDIADLANYLEEMDYDLVGYGFVKPALNIANNAVTIEDIQEEGYTIWDNRDDGVFRYYNSSGEMYDGVYYSAYGIPVNNVTGETASGEYTDQYGIIRSTEEITDSGKGKITGFVFNTQSNLLKSYLLSDYRIYTLRNDDQGIIKKAYSMIAKTFGGFDGAWATGLIKLYHAENGIAGEPWGFWNEFLGKNDISIDYNTQTLNIRKGWFNQKTSFKIEGWAARYGMSLEFLLSLHIGTMAPDLVDAMLQNFDTEIQVYLQDAGSGSVESVYVDPDSPAAAKNPESGITLSDIKDKVAEAPGLFAGVQSWAINSGAATDWVNSLAMTKAKAQYLLLNTNLESPANCSRFSRS